ncbi:hypothetical protein SK128_002966 [Halocaridina rubra]|uniref:Winged helix Storkhead-box1 domain-containing protein n=1 Tax=Halocaridina rubra TaxID=373956 RepID=A0AAN8WQ93_HALRR
MGESCLWLHERCLALQLLRDDPPPTRPSSLLPRSSRHCLGGHSCESNHNTEAWCSSIITPTSPSTTESGTPTPTNGGLPTSPTKNSPSPAQGEFVNKYQDGYLLFQAWQEANTVCVWNPDLLSAINESMYVGLLVGGILLIGGSSKALATITHAWSRSLLVAPTGFTLSMLGEVSGCRMVPVPQGHFTPLAEALCWVIHRLTKSGGLADSESVNSTLTASFPTLNIPNATIIHATLSNLIHQRKVYHSGKSYGIVQPNTYQFSPANNLFASPSQAKLSPLNGRQVISQPVQDSADFKPLIGGAQLIKQGRLCHAIVQTNLVELITGATLPTDKIITSKSIASGRDGHLSLERKTSLGMLSSKRCHSRTASLRLSPNKVAQLASAFSHVSSSASICDSNIYEAYDMNDITVKPERGSVISKLLRVSPRRKLASFSAQFPPPEWNAPNSPIIHLHSVAIQTSRQRKVSSDLWWSTIPSWTPRSSTLPRRLQRPLSCTPPMSQSSNSATPPLMQASSIHVLGPESLHVNLHTISQKTSHNALMHHSSGPVKGSLDKLQSESVGFIQNTNRSSQDIHRYHSQSRHSVNEHRKLSTDILNQLHYAHFDTNKMLNKTQNSDGLIPSASPEHLAYRKKSHLRSSKRLLSTHHSTHNDGQPRPDGEVSLVKSSEENKPKECTSRHHLKQKPQENTKEKLYKMQENTCKYKAFDKHNKEENHVSNNMVFEMNDYDETPVRDLPFIVGETPAQSADTENTKTAETKSASLLPPKKTKVVEEKLAEQERKNSKAECLQKVHESAVYNRSSLQLDLTVLHMNNSKKVVSSPHRPEGLKTNVLHDSKEVIDITKSSIQEVTNRNLGYRDVDKCHKQSCSQTLDKANQVMDQKEKDDISEPEALQQSSITHNTHESHFKSKYKSHCSPKKKLATSISKDPNIVMEEKAISSSKPMDAISPDGSNTEEKKISPDAEVVSINTYPSLSELNLNFTSIAAQRILHGVSHNSIDTLVEVNMAAQRKKYPSKCPNPVTNTDFGFL